MPVFEIQIRRWGKRLWVRIEASSAEEVLQRARIKGYELVRHREVGVEDETPPEIRAIRQLCEASKAFAAGAMPLDELRARYEGLARDPQTEPIVGPIVREELQRIEAMGDSADLRLAQALAVWIARQILAETGVEVMADPKAWHRIRGAADAALSDLSSRAETSINLPFIAADTKGPRHFSRTVTREELELVQASAVSGALRQSMKRETEERERELDAETQEAEQLVALMRRGDPRGYAKSRCEIAPGWLREALTERFGVLCTGSLSDLVWVDLDPATQQPERVQALCSLDDIIRIRRFGFLRPRVELRASGGGLWVIRIDRRRITSLHRFMIDQGLLLHLIQRDLDPVAARWTPRH